LGGLVTFFQASRLDADAVPFGACRFER